MDKLKVVELKKESALSLLAECYNDLLESGQDASKCLIFIDDHYYQIGYHTTDEMASDLIKQGMAMICSDLLGDYFED